MKEQAGRTGALASLIVSRRAQSLETLLASTDDQRSASLLVCCGWPCLVARTVTGKESTSKAAPRTLVAMPKDATPPPPTPQYEGFRWLGSQWGRTGNPKPSRLSAVLMLAAAIVVYTVAINAVRNDSTTGAVLASVIVGTACLLAATFYLVEGHFAARARLEQAPTLPESQVEPPASADPSVGP